MLANKWALLALSLTTGAVGWASTVDWDTYLPSKGGFVIIGIAVVKSILSLLMPGPGDHVQPVNNSIVVTHKTV